MAGAQEQRPFALVDGYYLATDLLGERMAPLPAFQGSRANRQMHGLWILLAVAVLAGSTWWWLTGRHQATPWVVEGYASADADATAIGLHKASMRKFNNEGFGIAGADWRTKNGAWHQGDGPTCVKPKPDALQHVRLGVIENRGPGGASQWAVLWIECLD